MPASGLPGNAEGERSYFTHLFYFKSTLADTGFNCQRRRTNDNTNSDSEMT